MKNGRWGTIEDILDKALELPHKEQAAYVKYACKNDEELEKEVLSLLSAIKNSEKENFLGDSSTENSALIRDITQGHIADHFIGKRIGVYELKEQIGHGGMSLVFIAERVDGQFKQQAAVKLIRNVLQTRQIFKRFDLEKQILANLTHTNIAHLYDGGVTEDGNSYLVMEYVKGKPINQYCDENKLTINQRLTLFKDTCKAVEYAHTNLIVHRDLKAQNILVTREGIVKVLDFGIAKLLDADHSADQPLLTQPGQELWTPQYASPEQINGASIATATYVYSLGVLLHKLLTGRFPYDVARKKSHEVSHIINNIDPETLGQSLSKANSIEKTAEGRSTTPYRLTKKLDKDIEAITLKALQKNVASRYSSVGKLVEDIEKYESDLPVSARNENRLNTIKKFSKRHKKAMFVFLLFIMAFISLSIYYTRQINHQKQQAIQAAEEARQVTQVLTSLFIQADPNLRSDPNITLREVLDKGAERIQDQLDNQPLIKARLLGLIGSIYSDMGAYNKAENNLMTGINILKKYDKQTSFTYLNNISLLGYAYYRQGYYQKADSLHTIVLWKIEESENSNSITYAPLFNRIGMLYQEQGKLNDAIDVYKKILKMNETSVVKIDRGSILNNLGLIYQNQDKFKKSISVLEKSLKLKQAQVGNVSPDVANTTHNLAFSNQRAGMLKKADSLHQIALPMMRKLLPPSHPHLASELVKYGLLKVKLGKLKHAEAMFLEGKAILEKILPKGHWQITSAKGSLALTRGLMGKLDPNIQILKKIYDNWETQFGKSDWRTQMAHQALQTLLTAKKRKS